MLINDFSGWSSLNDSIMGGSSYANCVIKKNGLELTGNIIEEGGGFVSCRSPIYRPPLDLSLYRGLQIEVEGRGRTLKLAVYCKDEIFGINKIFYNSLHWVSELPTKSVGTTIIDIPFDNLRPTIRAKRLPFNIEFNSESIKQFQILHSKFGAPGELNPRFISGQFNILLRTIRGLS